MKRTSLIQKSRMQALSILFLPHTILDSKDIAPISTKSNNQDCSSKIKIDHIEENFEEENEFSFACANPEGSLIFADEILDNGQIRPIYPFLNQSRLSTNAHDGVTLPLQPQLKKLSVKQCNFFSSKLDNIPEGRYFKWLRKMTMLEVEVKTSNEIYKKSNSTGFLKIWRFRNHLKLQSNDNGMNALVFLNPSVSAPAKAGRFDEVKVKSVVVKKNKGRKCKTTLSPHEKHYLMSRMRKENNKHRSFLPYRQELVGFFTNGNSFSRNLHPF